MANRGNHYELAFEAFLREHRIAHVAVDEKRRSLIGQGSLISHFPDELPDIGMKFAPTL